MNSFISDAQRLLAARFDDLLERSDRGELACGNFLSPADAAFIGRLARERGVYNRVALIGGYSDAERRFPVVIPEYALSFAENTEEIAQGFFADELQDSVRAVLIKGSGYRVLSHRDYLGSILALGVERDRVGDIVILDDHSAVIICAGSIFDFMLYSVERIASDKVSVSKFEDTATLVAKREFLPINDTVASERLDCIVAALTNLSREKAQALIKSGLCELDYTVEIRCDREIVPPCIVSVRGFGKYDILAFDGETRRARLRLVARKYI